MLAQIPLPDLSGMVIASEPVSTLSDLIRKARLRPDRGSQDTITWNGDGH